MGTNLIDKIPFSFIQCSSDHVKDIEMEVKTAQEGAIYFVLDTKQIFLGKNNSLIPMGKSSGIIFAKKDTDLNNVNQNVSFLLTDLEDEYQGNYPQPNDLIFNKDGCFYRVLEVDGTQIKTLRLTVAGGGGGGGGALGGGGGSTVILGLYETANEDTMVYGETCVIKYEFWASTMGTREIIVNDIRKETKTIPSCSDQNRYQTVDITKYLVPGDNIITIKVADAYGTYSIIQLTRNVVKLEIDDSSLTANGTKNILLEKTNTFTYKFIPYGNANKTLFLTLKKDGEIIKTKVDNFSDHGYQKDYEITGLTYGIYTLDVEMIAEVNGVTLNPVTASYVIMCVANAPNPNTQEHSVLLASYMPIAATAKNGMFAEVAQGKQVSIQYMLNDPANITDASVALNIRYRKANGQWELIKSADSETTFDGRPTKSQTFYTWDLRDYPISDEVQFMFVYSYKDKITGIDMTIQSQIWTLKVVKADVGTNAVTSDVLLNLSAQGRSNSEAEDKRNVWTYGDITTTFSGINWIQNNASGTGWLRDSNNVPVLRLSGEATAEIDFKPFSFKTVDDDDSVQGYNLIESGFTLELDFAIRDVNNEQAVPLSCLDGEGVGFEIKSNRASLVGRGKKEIFSNFNENERIRVTFRVESNAKTDQGEFVTNRLTTIYLNGVMSNAIQYGTNETYTQTTPIGISIGSPDCSIDIYNIKCYKRALTSKEIVNNFIYDITNPVEQTMAHERNDIYDDYNNISYSKLTDNNSIMTIIGPLPAYKGDKRGSIEDEDIENPDVTKVIVKYECLDKDLNFEDYCQIDVQGTSSQFYIRKNWKIKCKNKQLIDHDQIKTKTFCMKADYADATGTHNTQHANLIHDLYSEKTPAQKDDPKCRTTIYGYPVIMFHQADAESTPEFIGKYNFNFDKGSEEVFGFTEDYEVECWEFCNNDSNACNFLGPIPLNWKDDFEPRYLAPFKINEGSEDELEISFDRIEKLQEKTSLTPEENTELMTQRENAIRRFKRMHDWVRSTDQSKVNPDKIKVVTENGEEQEIINTQNALLTEQQKEEMSHWEGSYSYLRDSKEYRKDKFKQEFENVFDLHYCLIYYVYTFVNLMVDQRAKNMFLTYWGSTGKWQPWLYDNDTCFGINNSGEVKYLYHHEDDDQYESINVYNGANSVLWSNFKEVYATEIKETYATLRKEKLTYNKYIERFITKGSDQWGEQIYNEDIEYKYLKPLMGESLNEKGEVVYNDSTHLSKIQGTGEEYFRYFINKRLEYCDSKWYAGDFPGDYIELRVSTPDMPEDGWTDISEPNHQLHIKPYSNMYTAVRYKANGTLQQAKTAAGQVTTFNPIQSEMVSTNGDNEENPDQVGNVNTNENGEEELEEIVNGKFNDTEVGIYGASNLSSIGDISRCYCRLINIGQATKLVELIAGNEDSRYSNNVLHKVTVGSNKLLRKINLSNCPLLTGEFALENCPNLRELYLFGTSYTSLSLPESGNLEKLRLPDTLTKLVLKNQPSITEFKIGKDNDDFSKLLNLTEISIQNCPTIETQQLAVSLVQSLNSKNENLPEDKKQNLYMTFTNINWNFSNADFLLSLLDNPHIGSTNPDTDTTTLTTMYITGTCHIETINGADMARIRAGFSKNLKITYDNLSADLSFYLGGDEKDAYYHYEYKVGDVINETDFNSFKQIWTNGKGQNITNVNDLLDYFTPTYSNGEIVSGTCKAPVEIIRDLSTPIQIAPTQEVIDGGSGYNPVGRIIEAPKKASTAQYDYQFSGWAYSPGATANENILNNIEQNTIVYATFTKTIRKYSVYFYNDPLLEGKQPILSYVGDNMIEYGQRVPELPPDPKYPIQDLAKDYSFTGWSPNPYKIEGETHCYAQYSYTAYAPVRLIERKIIEFNSDTLITIGDYAFYNCTKLEVVNTPNVLSIGKSAFEIEDKGQADFTSSLHTLILLNEQQVCSLGVNALTNTLIEKGQGFVYVADNMVNLYKEHDDWKQYKNQIKSINELNNSLEVNE